MLKQRLEPPKPILTGCKQYEGLSGWTIIPIIGLFIAPLTSLGIICAEDQTWVFDQSQWEQVSQTVSTGTMWLVGFELVFYGFSVAAPILTLIGMFQRRYFIPKVMIALYLLKVFFLVIDFVFYESLGLGKISDEQTVQLAKAAVIACLWCSYFSVSKRVKATFRS